MFAQVVDAEHGDAGTAGDGEELDHFLSRLFGEVLSQPGFGFHRDLDAGALPELLSESAEHYEREVDYRLDNLTAIVDRNTLQITGPTHEVCDLEPLEDKLRAFGWGIRTIDGHDITVLSETLSAVPFETGKPNAVIARTVKGKGISFMENDPTWHHRVPDDKQYEQAQRELAALLGDVTS